MTIIEDGLYLEVGGQTANDSVTYPDDLQALLGPHGKWQFVHKDGAPS